MKRAFILTPSASRDLDGIFEFILERSGPKHALRVHDKIDEAFSRIAARPKLVGHMRDDLADESLRVVAVFSYLIVYRPDTKPVQIVRVIHGARELPRAFDEDA